MKVFVDVDTIGAFFDGNLPVPGANSLRPILKKLTKLSKEQKIPVLKFNDEHDGTEPEMKCNGGPFDIHALRDTEDAACIRETANKKAHIFTKQTYDVFDKTLGNKNVVQWIKDNNVTEAWVYGVATDWCIKAAVLGLRKLGIKVYVFENAIMGIDEETTKEAIKEMRKAGANFTVVKL